MALGDQYPVKPAQVKTLATGERVIIDRTLTLQYVYNVYYWSAPPRSNGYHRLTHNRITNIAALSILASTYLEKERGFWAANVLALCSSWIGVALLAIFGKELGESPPHTSMRMWLISCRTVSSSRRCFVKSWKGSGLCYPR